MDDLISRQAAIEKLRDAENHSFNSYYKGLLKAHHIIADLPSIQIEQKKGHWINDAGFDKCSKCGVSFPDLAPDYDKTNYCPNCGVRMEEQKDE